MSGIEEPDVIGPDYHPKKTFGDRVRGIKHAFFTRYVEFATRNFVRQCPILAMIVRGF